MTKALNTTCNPVYLDNATETEDGLMSAADKTKLDGIPAGGGAGQSFLYTVPVGPSEVMTVTIPVAMANVNYAIQASLGDVASFVLMAFPTALRGLNSFTLWTSGLMTAGDTIFFTLTAI